MTQMPKRFWGTMTEFQNEPEGGGGGFPHEEREITVLRKGFTPDLIREHLTEPPEAASATSFGRDRFLYTGGGNARRLLPLGVDRSLPLGVRPVLRCLLYPLAAAEGVNGVVPTGCAR